eukprot:scaffold7033_cov257-Pinguiococcus_pyrenoidosus.AAC.13
MERLILEAAPITLLVNHPHFRRLQRAGPKRHVAVGPAEALSKTRLAKRPAERHSRGKTAGKRDVAAVTFGHAPAIQIRFQGRVLAHRRQHKHEVGPAVCLKLLRRARDERAGLARRVEESAPVQTGVHLNPEERRRVVQAEAEDRRFAIEACLGPDETELDAE